jgi:hypothetical protein
MATLSWYAQCVLVVDIIILINSLIIYVPACLCVEQAADEGNSRAIVFSATTCEWVSQLAGPAGTLPHPTNVCCAPTGEVVVTTGQKRLAVFSSPWDDRCPRFLGQGKLNQPHGLAIVAGTADDGSIVVVADADSQSPCLL